MSTLKIGAAVFYVFSLCIFAGMYAESIMFLLSAVVMDVIAERRKISG